MAALQDSLGESAHSELALFALFWLVVTFPCGIEHILVMIRLRVVYGSHSFSFSFVTSCLSVGHHLVISEDQAESRRRVGQVLPSYQNRQISALDEMADAPQFSLSLSLSLFLSLLSFSLSFSLSLSLSLFLFSLSFPIYLSFSFFSSFHLRVRTVRNVRK